MKKSELCSNMPKQTGCISTFSVGQHPNENNKFIEIKKAILERKRISFEYINSKVKIIKKDRTDETCL